MRAVRNVVQGLKKKQGRIHGYLSRVRVGRGSDEIDQLISWAGAVTQKPPVNAKKAKCYGRTDGRTDGQTYGQTGERTVPLIEVRGRI